MEYIAKQWPGADWTVWLTRRKALFVSSLALRDPILVLWLLTLAQLCCLRITLASWLVKKTNLL